MRINIPISPFEVSLPRPLQSLQGLKLGIVASNETSPSSFYRAFGVLPALARREGMELVIADCWNWAKLFYCDALFMHCPVTAEHVELAKLARRTQTPVWVDHDDNVCALNRDNAGYGNLMRPEAQRNIRRCIELASVVTVSTENLEHLFQTIRGGADCDTRGRVCSPEIRVIPNALNPAIWPFQSAECGVRSAEFKRVTWRGGPAHFSDLEAFGPSIGGVARKHPDWQWHFIGRTHWGIERWLPAGSFTVHEWLDLTDYADLLQALRPSVQIVPMAETAFNLAKSNCCWLEASAAGAVTFAPAWTEWARPGIVNYRGLEDFGFALDRLLEKDAAFLARRLGESRRFIQDNLLLNEVNEQRAAVLRELTGRVSTRERGSEIETAEADVRSLAASTSTNDKGLP